MKNQRRILASVLIVLGALLWWFAPETPGGVVMMLIGIIVEIVGIFLEHRRGVGNRS